MKRPGWRPGKELQLEWGRKLGEKGTLFRLERRTSKGTLPKGKGPARSPEGGGKQLHIASRRKVDKN